MIGFGGTTLSQLFDSETFGQVLLKDVQRCKLIICCQASGLGGVKYYEAVEGFNNSGAGSLNLIDDHSWLMVRIPALPI